jgi:hypothetical protein
MMHVAKISPNIQNLLITLNRDPGLISRHSFLFDTNKSLFNARKSYRRA